ncbi:MAG: glycerophosphodiester phosphodiesterase [Burkholderiales bacterium RIFOXYC12_FULL_65_23]|uniref:glycerophosphodiester phosphodiesterase n=1 Tax=Malikia spinosa TaxID=86180 RepID=UPI0008D1824E|nr:glycerophosphodiester phosphodiesterase [Malikia spinosa]OGB68841.1 MAG: glycerophosphodiester phosphodiesterase [Burkholderiales bacterium RIFOXYC12_FULL_65_23]
MKLKASIALLSLALLQACGDGEPAFQTLSGEAPLVIGHRGASGERPEHTLASYQLAIEQGADFIEPDLVLTQDGVMIARHEPMLGGTTDVAAKFPARKTKKMVDGVETEDWFASDFTLAEIKTLRAIQARSGRSKAYDGQFQIPTLDEVIALAKEQSSKTGRTIGIYPEVKHSTFHAALFGANRFEDKLVSTLHAAYGNTGKAPVFIQSFEVSNLQYLNSKTDIKLVQLIDADDVKDDGSMSLVAPYHKPYDFVVKNDSRSFGDLVKPAGLDFIKTYADAVGPWKPYLVKTVNDGVERSGDSSLSLNDRRVDGSTGVIENAHARGLLVHTWTFRNDASGYGFKDPKAEMEYYMKLGVDGVFTDFPATGVAALNALR